MLRGAQSFGVLINRIIEIIKLWGSWWWCGLSNLSETEKKFLDTNKTTETFAVSGFERVSKSGTGSFSQYPYAPTNESAHETQMFLLFYGN